MRWYLILLLTSLTSLASAASFDCGQAQTPLHKLICSDGHLSSLNEKIRQSYTAAKYSGEAPELEADQQKWQQDLQYCIKLEFVHDQKECIKRFYNERIHLLEAVAQGTQALYPHADQRLSCDEFINYPNQVFATPADLGSGVWSPTDVDFDCPQGLSTQSFLKPLLELTEEIRSEEPREGCTGTIVSALTRYYLYELQVASYAPEHFEHSRLMLEALWESYQLSLEEYFAYWSTQSKTNHELYTQYQELAGKAAPLIASFYLQQFKTTPQRAQRLTQRVLDTILTRAAGAYPSRTAIENNRFYTLLKKGISLAELKKMPLNKINQHELIMGLNTALLFKYPRKVIQLFIKHIDDLNIGHESPLFYALHRMSDILLLVEHGAKIDYPNGFGKTPLYYAIQKNDHELTRYFIRMGANVNHRYKSAAELKYNCNYALEHTKRTPLMHAAQHADVEMLKLLIASGAKPKLKDEIGFQAIDYAETHGKKENKTYLQLLDLNVQGQSPTSPCTQGITVSAIVDRFTRGSSEQKAYLQQLKDCLPTNKASQEALDTAANRTLSQLAQTPEASRAEFLKFIAQLFLINAKEGYAPSQYHYASLYNNDPITQGLLPPDAKAFEYWTRKAAAQEEPRAIFNIAVNMASDAPLADIPHNPTTAYQLLFILEQLNREKYEGALDHLLPRIEKEKQALFDLLTVAEIKVLEEGAPLFDLQKLAPK